MSRTLLYDIKVFNPDKNLSYTTDPQLVSENRKKLDKIPRKVELECEPDGIRISADTATTAAMQTMRVTTNLDGSETTTMEPAIQTIWIRVTQRTLPYWSLVIPLTLLSAWMLLSKPRPSAPKPSEPSQAAGESHA